MRWRIKYSKEADNYFIVNGLLVESLVYAIIAVAENRGFPEGPYVEGPRIEIAFDFDNHTIVYERWLTQQMIRVTQILPGPGA